MMPRRYLPFPLLLLACHPTQLAQSCPAPATTPAGLLVTQVLLRRGSPGAPEYTLSVTASGDALYVGAPSLPVPGAYMGRLGPEGFQKIAGDLVARGLVADDSAAAEPSCGTEPEISVSLQTADGRYRGARFCGRSDSERRYAGPIYAAIERIRWHPGARILTLGPAGPGA